MINSELGHVTSVKEFNESIREQQEGAHGKDYCAIHDAITKYMVDCDSYMELGVHQGGTASAAMLCNPKRITLVDIDMSRYNKFLAPLAEQYCKDNNIELELKAVSSLSLGSLSTSDMLVIDSVHTERHMTGELMLHGGTVSKYIIAHDTSVLLGKQDDTLYRCLTSWGEKNGWKMIDRGTTNAGYTVIARK